MCQLHVQGQDAPIDEDIAELIQLMWDVDMMTSMSCQNNIPKDYIWIEFPLKGCCEKFLSLLKKAERKAWLQGVVEGFLKTDETNDSFIPHTYFFVRFPKTDHDIVLKRLKERKQSRSSSTSPLAL